jgi:hypothetical protein
MWIALIGLVIVLILVAAVVALRSRSDYPGSAKGTGQAANGVPLASKDVQGRAKKFIDLLNAGEVRNLKALTYTAQDASTAAAFVSAYGNRHNTLSSVVVDDFGGHDGELNITVPCKDSTPLAVTVTFKWKRTGWFSSNWFATLSAPGSDPLTPQPCIRP